MAQGQFSESSSIEEGIKLLSPSEQELVTTGKSKPSSGGDFYLHEVEALTGFVHSPIPVGARSFIDLDICTPIDG